MAQIGNLHTVASQHSVKEAVISFTLQPKIELTPDLKRLLEEGGAIPERFNKIEPIVIKGVSVNTGKDVTEINETRDKGFKLIRFSDGKVADIVQAIPQTANTLLTFNTIDYTNWSRYFDNTIADAKEVSKIIPDLDLQNLGVMFVDEFYFQEHSQYKPSEVFNLGTSTIPASIFDSDLTDFNLSNHKNSEEIDYMENLAIQVFNDKELGRKVIRITGNIMSFVSPIKFSEALKSEELFKYLNFGHEKNKEMLKSILCPNALTIIGL